MNNNLKHIDDLFLTENLLKDKNNLNNWLKSASVSSKSKFIDDIWYFDTSEIYHKSQNTINWDKKTSSGESPRPKGRGFFSDKYFCLIRT